MVYEIETSLLKITALALVACCFATNQVAGNLLPNGDNVCNYVTKQYVDVVVPFNATTYGTKVVKTLCADQWWGKPLCTRSIIVPKFKLMYRKTTSLKDILVYHCCSGWSRNAQGTKCSQPICGVACQNGGTCVAPDTCICRPGFSGLYCQNDVNECQVMNQCSQICVNTYGSFACSCRSGFKSEQNGFKCTDIDECQTAGTCTCAKNDGVCKATCLNQQGSYSCQCPDGYSLAHGKCIDRNECFEDYLLCKHKCINMPGKYRCECFDGFQLNTTTGECEDMDECSRNNGGCSQKCHNIVGGSVCSCNGSFYLDKDRKTCTAIQPPVKGKVLCEDNKTANFDMIDCPPPKKIGVLYASFGRLSADYCQTGNYTTSTTCQAKDVQSHIDRSCNLRSACTLMASKTLYGDPCPGTSKYLQVVYECF